MTHATLVQSCKQNVTKVLQLGGHSFIYIYIYLRKWVPACVSSAAKSTVVEKRVERAYQKTQERHNISCSMGTLSRP